MGGAWGLVAEMHATSLVAVKICNLQTINETLSEWTILEDLAIEVVRDNPAPRVLHPLHQRQCSVIEDRILAEHLAPAVALSLAVVNLVLPAEQLPHLHNGRRKREKRKRQQRPRMHSGKSGILLRKQSSSLPGC